MAADDYARLRNIKIWLARELTGRRCQSATLYAFDSDPMTLPCETLEGGTEIRLDELGMWSLLKLE